MSIFHLNYVFLIFNFFEVKLIFTEYIESVGLIQCLCIYDADPDVGLVGRQGIVSCIAETQGSTA